MKEKSQRAGCSVGLQKTPDKVIINIQAARRVRFPFFICLKMGIEKQKARPNMRKKLILFTNDEIVKTGNYGDLKDVFGGFIDIEAYSLDQYIQPGSVDGDLVLSVTPVELDKITPYLKHDIDVFHGNRTLLSESYNRLKALPAGTRALVVSTNLLATVDLTMFLIKSGIRHVTFMPVYREMTMLPEADAAIIPQDFSGVMEVGNLPKINLGRRRITDETYRAVSFSLGIDCPELEERIENKTKDLVKLKMTDISLSKICALEDMLNATLNKIEDGVVITTAKEKIIYINQAFFKMLNIKGDLHLLEHINARTIPPDLFHVIMAQEEADNELLELENYGKSILVTKKKIYSREKELWCISIFKDTIKIEHLETKIRGALKQQAYKARYTFSDIIGKSKAITRTLDKARKIAGFEKTTLLLGESGTGKEMIAQAMHNISGRRRMPFVAINCAALSSELIESELFGYEEGTFTGAKKGGKRGLFEIAHNGTLFLDEIGTIPPDIQMKLLRVLQEHEIRRIGGEGVIPVNVWVIAATNSELLRSVETGEFRLDLYFRLNVFPIEIPPLRERERDAGYLIRHLVMSLNRTEEKHKQVDEALIERLDCYNWPGNIRELQNTVEFLYYMSDDFISFSALPDTLKRQLSVNRIRGMERLPESEDSDGMAGEENGPPKLPVSLTKVLTREEEEVLMEILMILSEKSMGRRRLLRLLTERGYHISEYKLRKLVAAAVEHRLLLGRGR